MESICQVSTPEKGITSLRRKPKNPNHVPLSILHEYINCLVIASTFRHAGPDPASRNRPDSGFRQNDGVQTIMVRLIRN
jgi:hypothetical protein